MSHMKFQIYISYSQMCLFMSSLAEPFNDWDDRHFSQGFSWRPGSVSFRALAEDGVHGINLYINEPIPPLSDDCIRAFRVPFQVTDGNIEVGSISDLQPFNIPIDSYVVQVEFIAIRAGEIPQINLRLNEGETNFEILRADSDIDVTSDLALTAKPAN